MSKLLYANFFRLWRNRLFQIGLGFMFFAGGFLVFQQYRQLVGYGTNVKLDSTMFGYTIMIGVISSIFCSLFVSTDYVDGTEREVLEFLYNAIPAGQEMQYSRRSTENIGEMAAYAAGLTVITTGIGAFFFNRKDIR